MVFERFKVQSDTGQITANGVDANGTFIVRGTVKLDLSFTAMKMYPDHCVFLWGNSTLDENKLAMADWNNPVPLEEIDSFIGEWGFEEGSSLGSFKIRLD